jgi:hypothetical protein
MVACSNEGCSKMLFDWAVQEHLAVCPYKRFKCEFCNELLSIKSLNKHLKTNCNIDWVEYSKGEQSSSPAISAYCKKGHMGYYFELEYIKKSFVLMYHEFVVFFKKGVSNWIVKSLSHKETKSIEITYWLPKTSTKYLIHTTIQIQPEHSLDELDEAYTEIPIEAMEMEFEVTNSDDDTDMTDRFFQQLLPPV